MNGRGLIIHDTDSFVPSQQVTPAPTPDVQTKNDKMERQ